MRHGRQAFPAVITDAIGRPQEHYMTKYLGALRMLSLRLQWEEHNAAR